MTKMPAWALGKVDIHADVISNIFSQLIKCGEKLFLFHVIRNFTIVKKSRGNRGRDNRTMAQALLYKKIENTLFSKR